MIATRPVTRETKATIFDRGRRNVIVTIHPSGDIQFRAKGLKTSYTLTSEALYALAIKKSVEAQAKEKKSKKNVKTRKGR